MNTEVFDDGEKLTVGHLVAYLSQFPDDTPITGDSSGPSNEHFVSVYEHDKGFVYIDSDTEITDAKMRDFEERYGL